MPRRPLPRRVGFIPQSRLFGPLDFPPFGVEELSLDELEAMRLVDMEGLYQEDAAKFLGVSRQTLARILERARKKVVRAIIRGAVLRIVERNVRIERVPHRYLCLSCGEVYETQEDVNRCIRCGQRILRRLPVPLGERYELPSPLGVGIGVSLPSLDSEVVSWEEASYIVFPMNDGISWRAVEKSRVELSSLNLLILSESSEHLDSLIIPFRGTLREALRKLPELLRRYE